MTFDFAPPAWVAGAKASAPSTSAAAAIFLLKLGPFV